MLLKVENSPVVLQGHEGMLVGYLGPRGWARAPHSSCGFFWCISHLHPWLPW